MRIYSFLLLMLVLTHDLMGYSPEDFDRQCLNFYEQRARFVKNRNNRENFVPESEDNIFQYLDREFRTEIAAASNQAGRKAKRESVTEFWARHFPQYFKGFKAQAPNAQLVAKCNALRDSLAQATELNFPAPSDVYKPIISIEPLSFATNLRTLNLSGHALKGDSLRPLLKIATLETLNISNNSLSSDDVEILADHEGLKVIDFSSNLPLDKIPNLPRKIENITAVDCRITKVDKLINLKELQNINLSKNKIEMFSGEIFLLPKLKKIDLSDNSITFIDFYGALGKDINLKNNKLKIAPLRYTPNPSDVETEGNVNEGREMDRRESIHESQIMTMDISQAGVSRALNFSSIDSITLYAIRLSEEGEANLLRELFYLFRGRTSSIFNPKNPKVQSAIKDLVEDVRSGKDAKYFETLRIICSSSDLAGILEESESSLLRSAAITPIPSVFKLFLYHSPIDFLRRFDDRCIKDPDLREIFLKALNHDKPSDFNDREDPIVADLRERSKSVADPQAQEIITTLCKYLGDTQREIRACREELTSSMRASSKGQATRVFLTEEEEKNLRRDETGKSMAFYAELQGRIMNYFYVAALISTDAIPYNYENSIATSLTGFAAKTFDFLSKVIPGFGGAGQFVSLPFTLVSMYSENVDKELAKAEFLLRANVGNQNILQFLEIAKLYSLEITHQLRNQTQITNSATDAEIAFRFFLGSIGLFGFRNIEMTQTEFVIAIATKTVAETKRFRDEPQGEWIEGFKESSKDLLQRLIEGANSDQIATIVDQVTGIITDSLNSN